MKLPRIGVQNRGPAGAGNFYNTETGEPFFMYGANFIKLCDDGKEGGVGGRHCLFTPDFYDSYEDLEWEIKRMGDQGQQYNALRVFIPYWGYPGNPGDDNNEDGLNSAYMDRVARFVSMAAHYGLYTSIVLDYFPQTDYYREIKAGNPTMFEYLDTPEGLNYNAMHMNQGHINAKIQFVREFINAVKRRVGSAEMSNIISWEFDNEMHFRTDLFPFNQYGKIKTASGVVFDMGNIDGRQSAADFSAVHYVGCIANEIREVDPEAMTSVGGYSPYLLGMHGPDGLTPGTPANKVGETRRPVSVAAMTNFTSMISYARIHCYPKPKLKPYSFADDLASINYDQIIGPISIQEFGAYKDHFPTINEATKGISDFIKQTKNFNIAGLMYWSARAGQPNSWDLYDPDNRGAMNYMINPKYNPWVAKYKGQS